MRAIVPLLILVLTSPAAARTRLEFLKLEPQARLIVANWLNSDCQTAKPPTFKAQLVRQPQRLEEVFWEFIELGPPEKELEERRVVLRDIYPRRIEWLRREGERLFGKQDLQKLLAISEEEFVKSRIEKLVATQRAAAIAALGVVGSERSRSRLQEIVDDETDVHAAAAARALRKITRNPAAE